MRPALALACVLPSIVAVGSSLAACSTLPEDPPTPVTPDPLGTGQRIAQVQDPSSQSYQQALTSSKTTTNPGVNVDVSSVVVTWIDTFDETRDGKSKGTVYVQDVGSTAPYAGISVYQPNYVPAALRPLPGDVLDMKGPYQELAHIGSATFNAGNTLPQLAKPVGDFRYEFETPPPAVVTLSDLDMANYAKGRQWEGMLVTVNDVTVGPGAVDTTGLRVTYLMGQGSAKISNTACTISNELYNLGKNDYPTGTHFTSVTGIVTWFYSYHLAPRTAADLVQ